MHEHAEVLNVLLSHCSGVLDDTAVEANDGFQVYLIALPGLDFIVEAKRTSKVGYTYIIRSYDRRFKVYTLTPRSEAMTSLIPKDPRTLKVTTLMPKARTPLPKPIPRTSTVMEAVSRKMKVKKAK